MTQPITERRRHALKFRLATVVSNERITPKMARVTLQTPDFADFTSDAYDDHVKLFFAPAGTALTLPEPGPNGMVFPEGTERPPARDYTPRRIDLAKGEVVFDFVLHGDGPAASWAETAAPGDKLGVGGPRASFVVADVFDWYLLVGDETALPAIGRRIEELPTGKRIIAFIEVADAAEIQPLSVPGDKLELHWVNRSDANAPSLIEQVRAANLPEGNGYAFIAGEAVMSTTLRDYLVETLGWDADRIKAAGYWRQGDSDFDDGHAH